MRRTWAASDRFGAARFHPVRCASLIVSTFTTINNIDKSRYENLLKQQQVPELDNLPVGGLRHATDLGDLLLVTE